MSTSMTVVDPLPSDSPARVLAEAARRRGLCYSRGFVRELLERHAQPRSLPALLEGGPALGLKPTPRTLDLETLEATGPDALPGVLVFSRDGEQGLGLLEAVLPGGSGFRVWDSVSGSRAVSREALAAAWSGEAVFLAPRGGGIRESGAWRRRAREWLLEEWRPRTGLVGPGGSPVFRWGLGVLAAVLVSLTVLAQPPALRWLTLALAGLTVLGLAAALAAVAWTRGGKAVGPMAHGAAASARGGRAVRLCGTGGRLDCDSVLLSDWASMGGVPLSGLGAAFFGASLLAQVAAALSGSAAPLWLAGAAFLAALPVSVVLVAVQVGMRRFCALCMTVHAVEVAGAALFLFAVRPALPVPPPGTLAAALLGLLLFGVLLATAVPTLLRREEDEEALRAEHARLLRSPLVTLAGVLAQPRLPVEGPEVGALLGSADAPHTLVALVHPSCAACATVVDELEGLIARHPATLRAFLGVAQRLEDPRDENLCAALAAAGEAWGGPVLARLYRDVKERFSWWMSSPDLAKDLGETVGRDGAEVDAAEAVGRARGRTARELLGHAQGLPALFLDGRPCAVPLSQVEAWCARPELLALLQGGPRSPQGRAPGRRAVQAGLPG